MVDPEMCSRCARRVPWYSLFGNLSLAIYKTIVGIFGGSAALVADAMHSFADVVGSTGILVATKVSAKAPDHTFPYGRGKAEFLGAVFVYTVLLFFGVGIVIHAIRMMLDPMLEAPHFITLLGAVISVLYNYIMYKYATCVGKRNRSPAILADAFENRADAISSVACIAGILGALYVHPVCDPIAALVVGIIIFWNCQEQLREAALGLMDGGLPVNDAELVARVALAEHHVVGISFLRSRHTGARYWLDLGIEVDADLDVRAADKTATAVRKRLAHSPHFHHIEVFVSPASPAIEKTVKGRAEAAASLPS